MVWSVTFELLIGSKHPLPLSQESIGIFLQRTCAFGIEAYFVHSQATESFGGSDMAESYLCFDDK